MFVTTDSCWKDGVDVGDPSLDHVPPSESSNSSSERPHLADEGLLTAGQYLTNMILSMF